MFLIIDDFTSHLSLQDPLDQLSTNIQFFTSALVSSILPYCSDLLFLDDQEVLPEDLRPRLADPQ